VTSQASQDVRDALTQELSRLLTSPGYDRRRWAEDIADAIWPVLDDAIEQAREQGRSEASIMTVACRLPQRCTVRVDRTALRHLLLELQDLRARQGVEPTWTDRLHPTLARELDAAIRDEAAR
jgi:hypothetical protein